MSGEREALLEDCTNEADLCRNEGADDCANLLDRLNDALTADAQRIAVLDAEIATLKSGLTDYTSALWQELENRAQSRIAVLEAALRTCEARFDFYADEHADAGKIEKSQANRRYAELIRVALEAKP